MDELKIVITGCVGAGKSTAIQSISDIPVISTDEAVSDDVIQQKDTTTVALDYGEVSLENGQIIKLYGTPGQERFSYMWHILAEGALGIVVLINHRRPDPLADLELYLSSFQEAIRKSTAVIGVTHVDDMESGDMDGYYDYLAARALDYPVFSLDARDREQVKVLIEAMAAMISIDEGLHEQVI